ncbi:MAG TPA: DUF5694 domain-containing protein [Longimicrobiales bacterium]|nr:DUF5694 domain-containing protein [Longimicrobiales bacterium]
MVRPSPGADRSISSGRSIEQVLAPQVVPAFQSEVMVLGSIHLAGERDRLTEAHLAPLLSRLEAFAPTRIAIEALTSDELALLAMREAHDPAAAELLGMFGGSTVAAGRSAQQHLGIDYVTAELRARSLLDDVDRALTDDERLSATAWLVAAYDFNSAALQWSYLPAAVRADASSLPADVHDMLQRRLQGSNEIVTVAMALARRLGLQRLYPMDSQYEGVRTLALPRAALTALLSDPARGALLDREWQQRADSIRSAGFADGDLLPLYRFTNSDEYQRGDLTQWRWLFRNTDPAGLDRFRYAMWELRNVRQAANVVDIAASSKAERVLVLVGASHKAHLDRILATQLGVRLVQFAEIAPSVAVVAEGIGPNR